MGAQRDERRDLTIVICTFHRLTLLAKALESIREQTCPDALRVSVLVVDNSDEGTARDVVEAAALRSPFDLRWAPAHPANIAVARNVGVQLTTSQYIAFIDDDNTLMSGWLNAVARAIRTNSHDVFFGAVDSVFQCPEWATPATRRLFSRHLEFTSGQDLFAFGRQKTRNIALATVNTVFRRAALPDASAPFDVSYGHGGGEDYDLFCRMQRNGKSFGWLPDALAQEFVPAARCEPTYLRRRFYVGGQTFAAGVAGSSASPALQRWWLRFRAVGQALLMSVAFPAVACRGGEALLDYSYRFAGVLGKMSFGEVFPLYRQAAGRRGAGG